ncbi:MAG: inositol monophosphatase family protein [Planctomycetales bacterium]
MSIDELPRLTAACRAHLPHVLRWAGAIARGLRKFDIGLGGKTSGSENTDALTLADLTCQELIVSFLRDSDPIFRRCRIEAEEITGDLARFAAEAEFTIAIDPIDGTKAYRDRSGPGYATMLLVRSVETVHYSLVFSPENGPHGSWMQACGDEVVTGADDPSCPAPEVVASLPKVDPATRPPSNRIYVIGFQERDPEVARLLSTIGLHGHTAAEMPGSLFELLATGEFGGALIHTPNVYDFPAALHVARILGGDAVWVHDRQPVHFRELWLDERADMLRLPGIVAVSAERNTREALCGLARDWPRERYR